MLDEYSNEIKVKLLTKLFSLLKIDFKRVIVISDTLDTGT